MQWLRNTYRAVVSRLLWNRTVSRLNIHECSGGATCLQVLIKQMSDTSHSFVKRRCFAKDEENIRNLCYKTETLKDQIVNNIFAVVSHEYGHIHSAVALLWFDCLRNRPRWIRQCNPETFPRSSVIPEVSPKCIGSFQWWAGDLHIITSKSPSISRGVKAFIYIRPRGKSSGSLHCLSNRLYAAGKKKKKKRITKLGGDQGKWKMSPSDRLIVQWKASVT